MTWLWKSAFVKLTQTKKIVRKISRKSERQSRLRNCSLSRSQRLRKTVWTVNLSCLISRISFILPLSRRRSTHSKWIAVFRGPFIKTLQPTKFVCQPKRTLRSYKTKLVISWKKDRREISLLPFRSSLHRWLKFKRERTFSQVKWRLTTHRTRWLTLRFATVIWATWTRKISTSLPKTSLNLALTFAGPQI